jgi:hypothetical protein
MLKMLGAARTYDHGIPHLLLHLRMMRQPPKRALALCQPMLLCDRSDNIQRVKVQIVPVPTMMQFSLPPLRIESSAFFEVRGIALVPIRQEATRERVEAVQTEPVVAQTREQLGLDGAV